MEGYSGCLGTEPKTFHSPHAGTLTAESMYLHGNSSDGHTSGLPREANQAAPIRTEQDIDLNLEKDILHSIISFINEVACSPGKFDKHIGTLLRDFSMWAKSKKATTEVSKMLIEKSISCQNFRYSGARFCTMLLNKSKDMKLGIFWDSLQYGLDVEKTTAVRTLERDYKRLRGLLMFLAELFVQLDIERAILGSDICFIIGMLLVQDTPESAENIRSVCQALKLSGRHLDKTHNDSMEEIFLKLGKVSEYKGCDKSVYNQITSLAAFRKSNWGERPSDPLPEKLESPRAVGVVRESVYCGPDGTDLSAEESRFLEENLDQPGTEDLQYLQELWEAEDPMNELDDAFEEFLRFSKQE